MASSKGQQLAACLGFILGLFEARITLPYRINLKGARQTLRKHKQLNCMNGHYIPHDARLRAVNYLGYHAAFDPQI